MSEVKAGAARAAVPQVWRVTVRHSPFVLKSAEVEAVNAAEARQKFLEKAKDAAEMRAKRSETQEGVGFNERIKAAAAIRKSFTEGAARAEALEWDVRTKAEADAQAQALKDRRDNRWALLEKLEAGVLTGV